MIERTFISQNIRKIELENYVKSQMDRASVTQLDIVKTPLVTRIVITAAHPGFAIGKGGSNIKRVTREIERRFKIDNPQIEIKEIPNPNLDAQTVANKMKSLIERGYSWRSVTYKVIRDIREANAQGVEVVLAGALGGKGQRKKKQRFAHGYMKKTGEFVKLVDYAKVSAYPKYGAIGIKIRIVKPDVVFPDKINLVDIVNPPAPKEEAKPEEKSAESKTEEKSEAETAKAGPEKAAPEKEEKKELPKDTEKKDAQKSVKKEAPKKAAKAEKPEAQKETKEEEKAPEKEEKKQETEDTEKKETPESAPENKETQKEGEGAEKTQAKPADGNNEETEKKNEDADEEKTKTGDAQ